MALGAGALLLTAMTALAATHGFADYYSQKSRRIMKQWELKGRVAPDESWQEAFDYTRLAESLNGYHAEYAFDLGRLHEWDALRHPHWSHKAEKARAKALRWYARATSLRPTYAAAWIHLAYGQILSNEMDQDVAFALEKAILFAPWEPKLRGKVIVVGLAAWEILDTNQREQIEGIITQALKNKLEADIVLILAIHYNRVENVRPLLVDEDQVALLEAKLAERQKEKGK